MSPPERERPSSYLQYLPAVLREGPFLGRFLLGFEAVLSGWVDPPPGVPASSMPVGLDYALDTMSRYFDPRSGHTPSAFLPWLAQWVALTVRDDWSEETRRALIASIVPLYKLRGTKDGIVQALQIALGEHASVIVTEPDEPAHYFRVSLMVGVEDDAEQIQKTIRMAESVVDQQKPAHTFYSLVIHSPQLQLLDQAVYQEGGKIPDRSQGIWVVHDQDKPGAIVLGSARSVAGTAAEHPNK